MTPEDTQTAIARLRATAASLMRVEEVPSAAFELTEAVRDLVEAAVLTDVDPAERAAVCADVVALTERLRAAQRSDAVWMVRHPDGSSEHLTQAAMGRLNPQALRLYWLTPDGRPAHDAIADPHTGEVLARCVLNAAHVGPPHRGHGGVVATILDHVVGFATAAVGKPGMTAGLDIRYRAATPLGVPLTVRARFTHSEGRKHFATGELIADGAVTASALGVFIGHPQWSESQ